ncbi:unnamed protein product [Lactuca saligna]|uniref:F-box domain-containing protein n=1 Tax=Lactuca saligna TaxID=75948 RepID=A0AA35VMC3_LACSI|nr:unnamed protein product [Lactuca saligna]
MGDTISQEKNKRRVVTCAKEDIISNLPEHLIDSILERVPLEEAARTSILSKNWRYRWTKMGALAFDEQFFKKYAKNGAFGRNGFIRIINKVLILHNGPISKFLLHIPNMNMFLDCFEEVDQWMLLLSRNRVKELILTNSNQRYQLPSYVFSCLELTKLKMKNCFFKPPLNFEGFLNLKDLNLRCIDFGASLCGTQINLPQLKKLSLHKCTNVYNFNIKATKLEKLTVIACPDTILTTMLSNMTKIKCFFVDAQFLKIFTAENIPKWVPQPINSLTRLWFQKFQLGDLHQLNGALCLLRNSPNLKTLGMHLEMKNGDNVGPASSILESPNCLDISNRLQTVKIECLQGSKPELLFVKLLLAHSSSLRKFTITPSRSLDVKKILDISKDVMRFSRASPKAEMIYLNPKP